MDMAHIQRIEELRRLSVPALKKKYKEVFGEETRSSHKQYLFRRIAWQLQAQLEGGLSERAVDRAVQIADDADLRSVGPKGFWSWPEQAQKIQPPPIAGTHRDGRLPKPGTLLTRRHKGRDVVVQVLEEGFPVSVAALRFVERHRTSGNGHPVERLVVLSPDGAPSWMKTVRLVGLNHHCGYAAPSIPANRPRKV